MSNPVQQLTGGRLIRSPSSLVRPPTPRTRRGNALIETAFALLALSFLVFGGVEFGYFFYLKHIVQGASREGARAAIVGGATNGEVTTAVGRVMSAAGLTGKYTLTLDPADLSTQAEGTPVTVTVNCTWSEVGVRPIGLIAPGKAVNGVTVMRKEGS